MPNPTPSQVHEDAALSNISVAYIQSQDRFKAGSVFPTIPVAKRSDKYFVYDKNDFFRDEARKRAPGTESAGGGFDLTTASYFCERWAYHHDVDDETRDNADDAIDPDADAVEFVTQKLLIRKENDWATNFFTTSVWDTDKTGGSDFTVWSNEATSDPLEDVKDGRLTIMENTGFEPNTFVVGAEVHEALKKHPLIMERIKAGGTSESPALVTARAIAELFEVEKYVVSKATYATNAEGATAAYDFSLGKNALLCYTAPRPSLRQPSAGYTFAWSGASNSNNAGIVMSSFRMPNIKSDRIEGEYYFDHKAVSTDLGYFFSGVVS